METSGGTPLCAHSARPQDSPPPTPLFRTSCALSSPRWTWATPPCRLSTWREFSSLFLHHFTAHSSFGGPRGWHHSTGSLSLSLSLRSLCLSENGLVSVCLFACQAGKQRPPPLVVASPRFCWVPHAWVTFSRSVCALNKGKWGCWIRQKCARMVRTHLSLLCLLPWHTLTDNLYPFLERPHSHSLLHS